MEQRGPQLFIFIFFALVRPDNLFPFSCSGWPARHLDQALPFAASQTRSSLRAFYPPTQLDTMQRDHAGSLAFPSGIERFEKKKPQRQRRTSPIVHFHKLYRFFLFPVAGFFFFIQSRQEARHIAFQQRQSWNTLLRFPQNRTISSHYDRKTHFSLRNLQSKS